MTLLRLYRGQAPHVPAGVGPLTLDLACVSAMATATQPPWPQQLFRVAAEEDNALAAAGATGVGAAPIPLAPGCWRHVNDLDLDVLVLVRSWDAPAVWRSLVRAGRRTLLLSYFGPCGPHGETWCDGPLGHLTAAGTLASYLPAGGDGALYLPLAPAPELIGLDLAAAEQLDAFSDERTHRCLLARMRWALQAYPANAALALSNWTLHTAVVLTLVRQARPDARLTLRGPAGMPAAWRRLLQNLDVGLTTGEGPALVLADLLALVPPKYVVAVARSVNSLSEVLPHRLLAEATTQT